MSAAFPKQAMQKGKVDNIHILIKMRALQWKNRSQLIFW